MEYCKNCGCYIPHNTKSCLACGGGMTKTRRPEKQRAETNRYMPTDEASVKAMDEAQLRRERMQEQFARHKAAAESRKTGKD